MSTFVKSPSRWLLNPEGHSVRSQVDIVGTVDTVSTADTADRNRSQSPAWRGEIPFLMAAVIFRTGGMIEVRNSDDMLMTCDIIIGLQLERDLAIATAATIGRWYSRRY